jgi:hypothetical protein
MFASIASGKQFATILCDVSGSVIANKFKNVDVLKMMITKLFDQLKQDNVKVFKVVWYGSPNPKSPLVDGFIIDYSTYLTASHESFEEMARKYAHCNNLTCPHYALDGFIKAYIDEDKTSTKPLHTWMNPSATDATRSVYFVCDGELYDGTPDKNRVSKLFSDSMSKFMNTFPHHRFTILAVDVSTSASSENVVGCDIYKAISNTKRINLFRVFTPSNSDGLNMFENRYVPITHVSFGNEMFLRTDEPMFYEHLRSTIPTIHDDSIVDLVRKASMSLADYIDKEVMATHSIGQIIHVYSNLFKLFVPNEECIMTKEELVDSFKIQVEKNLAGDAVLATEFRKTLTEKFQNAEEELKKDARASFGSTGKEMGTSFLLDNKLYIVPMRSVTHKCSDYNKSGFCDRNGTIKPIMPVLATPNDTAKQCIRQFSRYAMETYGVERRNEQSKFALLLEMLCVVRSDVPDNLKTWWRQWGHIMLEKKLSGKDITEIEHFRAGNVLNVRDVDLAATKVFGRAMNATALWYGICKEIGIHDGDDILCANQMFKNIDELEKHLTTLPKISVVYLEDELDYTCPIIQDSITSGFVFPDHSWRNIVCSPKIVISTEGLNGMTTPSGHVKCLYCRSDILRTDMTAVTKRDTPDCFPVKHVVSSEFKLIQMVGVPGSGKSHSRRLMMSELNKLHPDWKIHVLSVDDECVSLIRSHNATSRNVFKMAAEALNVKLGTILKESGVNVIIVDTCGDFKGDLFGHKLKYPTTRFESNMFSNVSWDAYAGGTLYEILSRKDTADFLNPIDTGPEMCISVHKKKMNTLYPNKYKLNVPATLSAALDYLKPYHDNYIQYLTENNSNDRIVSFVKSV